MADLNAFAVAQKKNLMVPDDVAAAHGRKTDAPIRARPGMPLARHDGDIAQRNATPLRRGLAKRQRRSAGRVDLVPMVRLDDLDIEILTQ